MRKVIIALIILSLPCLVSADIIMKVPGGEASSCPSGTYEFGYDGDHDSGADYCCYESGSANEVASANTADIVSTDWVEFNAADEYLAFTIVGDVSAGLDTVGSLFFDFYVSDDGDMGTNALIESYHDANNFIF